MLDREARSPGTGGTASGRRPCSICWPSRGVLQPADRAAAPDRVLRRTPAGVQLQHAGEEGARRTEHRRAARGAVRARHRSATKRQRRGRPRLDPARGLARPRRRSRVRRTRPTRACSTRSSTPTSIGPAIRCSIAPRRCSRSSSTRRCIRRRCSTCGIGCRSTRSGGRRGYAPHVPTGARSPRAEWIEVPPAARRSASIATTLPFGWDNEFPARARDVAGVRDRAPQRHERAVPRVRRRRRLPRRRVVGARGLELAARAKRIAHPLFWERQWMARGTGAACSNSFRCRCRGRSTSATPRRRVRALARRAAADAKRSISAPRSDRPDGERPPPVGQRGALAAHGVFDFSSWDPEPAGSHPRARAPGASRISSATAGSGRARRSRRSRASGRWRRIPEYSADFFDGEHMVMKGASPATARELLRPTFRNWFRARYPYVYATFRCVTRTARSTRLERRSPATSSTTWRCSRASSRRAISTMRSARRCSSDLRLPWYRITRAELATRSSARRGDLRARRRRCRASSSWGQATARSWRRSSRSGASTAGAGWLVHLIDVSPAALDRRGRALSALDDVQHRHARRRRTRPDCAERGAKRDVRGRTLVLFLGSNIGNFDRPAPTRFCARFARALGRRRRRCSSAPIS